MPGGGSDRAGWTGQPVVAPSQPLSVQEIADSVAGGRPMPFSLAFLSVSFYDFVVDAHSFPFSCKLVLMDECLFIPVMFLSVRIEIRASEAGDCVCFLN